MDIPILDAAEQLDDLIDLVEAAKQVLLTRDGWRVGQLTSASSQTDSEAHVEGS